MTSMDTNPNVQYSVNVLVPNCVVLVVSEGAVVVTCVINAVVTAARFSVKHVQYTAEGRSCCYTNDPYFVVVSVTVYKKVQLEKSVSTI